MTSEYEILRGDMAKIVYDSTKDIDNIEYVFNETIEKVEDIPESGVHVTFANHLPPTTYDVLVGADGMMSRTRRFVFGHGPNNDDYLRRLGQYGAFFKIPRTEDDTNFAQWYNASRGRLILKRPDQYGTTRAYMAVTDSDFSRFDEIDAIIKKRGVTEQKEWLAKEFDGAGWQSERVVRGMWDDEEFYMQQIAQVKMPEWYKGHVALIGDAGYCPSPISGVVCTSTPLPSNAYIHFTSLTKRQGAGAAIVGAYVLAGELSRSPKDIPAALKRYDETARPFVERVQKVIPGAPQIANPQTGWGIAAFNTIMGIFSYPFMRRAGGLLGQFVPAFGGTEDWKVPDYGSSDG